jgi:hypothetical protein
MADCERARAAGGYMTYFGPIGEEDGDCSVLLDYFAKLGSHLKPNQNPAEFILEVTGAGIPKAAKQIQRSDDSAEEEPAKPPAVRRACAISPSHTCLTRS